MRVILFAIWVFTELAVFGQRVAQSSHNYGKVKYWNNPVFETVYTNTSSKVQLFLPTAYSSSFKIGVDKEKLQPGESTTIRIQYFTEEFGKFDEQVELYINTLAEPIQFNISGKIVSFHPDALTVCPRIDNSDLRLGKSFTHTIRVIDKETGESLNDFDLELITNSSQEHIYSNDSYIRLRRDKPDLYRIEVDKEDYKIANTEVYISSRSPVTIVELEREEPEIGEVYVFTETEPDPEEMEEPEISEESTTPEIVYTPEIILDPEPDSGQDRNPEEEIIEKIVITDTATFDDDGKLSSTLFKFNHIVFLIDISGSMRHEDKLPLLKYSMNQMIDVLRPEDKVTIIVYSTEAKVILQNKSGADKDELKSAISKLEAKGHSYGKEGLDMAFEIAEANFIPDGNNEIILSSDGVFNSKNFSERKVFRQVTMHNKETDVRLSTIGFGHGMKALGFMEELARRGNGSFIRIKNEEEAQTVLITNLMDHSVKR